MRAISPNPLHFDGYTALSPQVFIRRISIPDSNQISITPIFCIRRSALSIIRQKFNVHTHANDRFQEMKSAHFY